MTDTRLGGAAIIAAAIAGILVMAVHPTSHEMFAPGKVSTVAALGTAVHLFAILSNPVAFLGALALARYLDSPNRLAMSALAIYGFALVAVTIAATLSGLVATPILHKIVEQPDPQWEGFAQYTGLLNQAFAKIYALLASVAIAIWSIPIVRTRRLPITAGIYGLVSATIIFVAVASGSVRLDVHGMGAVVLLQGIWFITIGVALYRAPTVRPAGS